MQPIFGLGIGQTNTSHLCGVAESAVYDGHGGQRDEQVEAQAPKAIEGVPGPYDAVLVPARVHGLLS
jgi:hypothetical protein